MARNIGTDSSGRVWRAVIKRVYTDLDGERSYEETFGPYPQRGTAKAQITTAENQARRYNEDYEDMDISVRLETSLEHTIVQWVKEEEA